MRSLRERIIHTALFEALAIALATPAIAALTNTPLVDSGALSLLVSAGAVVTNYGWTWLFDRLVPTRRRGLTLRVTQAAGLELGIATFTIPLAMWFTGLSFTAAVAFDAAGMVFFMLFSLAYNAVFDAAMLRIEARRSPQLLSR